MPSARLFHLEGVGAKKGPADESLQSPAAQPPYLRGSGVATCGRPVPHRAAGELSKKALRVETGQLKSTTVETLRREAGICSIATLA